MHATAKEMQHKYLSLSYTLRYKAFPFVLTQ